MIMNFETLSSDSVIIPSYIHVLYRKQSIQVFCSHMPHMRHKDKQCVSKYKDISQ